MHEPAVDAWRKNALAGTLFGFDNKRSASGTIALDYMREVQWISDWRAR
jgi:hypothetical protein